VSGREFAVPAAAVAATAAAGALHAVNPDGAGTFLVSAVALAALAALVGRGVDGVGTHLGAGATGSLQAALGNLPELLVGIFALRAGLVTVVQAALVGSIVANLLLVLGLAFVVGGLRHGPQRFDVARARLVAVQLLLAVAALAVPTLAVRLHTPAAAHEVALSRVVAVALLVVFALSVPAALRRRDGDEPREAVAGSSSPSLARSLVVLAGAGIGAAFASDWFVAALTPAEHRWHISPMFAGLVIVALAGNAVENVVGVVLAARNRPELALSIVLYSPLQIALVVVPVLVLAAPALGGVALSLALPGQLLAVLVSTVVVVGFVVGDGESTWLEGVALIALYAVSVSAFWWA
jgi:Ca2+:H+ antiporter